MAYTFKVYGIRAIRQQRCAPPSLNSEKRPLSTQSEGPRGVWTRDVTLRESPRSPMGPLPIMLPTRCEERRQTIHGDWAQGDGYDGRAGQGS